MEMTPIGRVVSPYKQKFAIPRQPNLVEQAKGHIEFCSDNYDPNCLRELQQFSHLWVIFVFHATDQSWTPTVQPPRLGGKERVGVYASRSPFRPNPIGISAVRNLGTRSMGSQLILDIGGIDLLHDTPVLDIKPYIRYADRITDATGGYANIKPGTDSVVTFSSQASTALESFSVEYPDLQELITAVLMQDPRPAWRVKEQDDKRYGMQLYDLNIKWVIEGNQIEVASVDKC